MAKLKPVDVSKARSDPFTPATPGKWTFGEVLRKAEAEAQARAAGREQFRQSPRGQGLLGLSKDLRSLTSAAAIPRPRAPLAAIQSTPRLATTTMPQQETAPRRRYRGVGRYFRPLGASYGAASALARKERLAAEAAREQLAQGYRETADAPGAPRRMFEGTIGDYIGQAVARREALGRGERVPSAGTYRGAISALDEDAAKEALALRHKSRSQARKEARLRVQAQKYGLGSVISQIIAAGGKVPEDMRLAAFGPAEVAERASKREAKTAQMQYGEPVLQAMRDVAALGNAELMAAVPPRERQRLLQGTGRGVGDLIASGGGLGAGKSQGPYATASDLLADRPELHKMFATAVENEDADGAAKAMKLGNVPAAEAAAVLRAITGNPNASYDNPSPTFVGSLWSEGFGRREQPQREDVVRTAPTAAEAMMLSGEIPITGSEKANALDRFYEDLYAIMPGARKPPARFNPRVPIRDYRALRQ